MGYRLSRKIFWLPPSLSDRFGGSYWELWRALRTLDFSPAPAGLFFFFGETPRRAPAVLLLGHSGGRNFSLN